MNNIGIEGERPDLSSQAKLELFKLAERMFQEGAEGVSRPLEISNKGMMGFEQMVALISNQPSIEVNKSHKGDVVWWIDESGSNYYYLLDKEEDALPMQGTLQVTDKSGDLILQGEKVGVRGATLGASIRVGYIAKNLMVEFAFPPKIHYEDVVEAGGLLKQGVPLEDIQYQIYHSGRVENMGIIQR